MGGRVRSGCAAALVMLLAGCAWNSFGYDAANTRASADTGISVAQAPNLHPAWTHVFAAGNTGAVDASIAVAGGVAYVPMDGVGTGGNLPPGMYAFDATGTGCPPYPQSCPPLWFAPLDGTTAATAAVANNVVFVSSYFGTLDAFGAAGPSDHCGGSPKTCTPLRTYTPPGGASPGAILGLTSPIVVGNVVYQTYAAGTVSAFSADGSQGCTIAATPVCAAIRTYAPPAAVRSGVISTPSIAQATSGPYAGKNILYLTESGRVFAFDADGTAGCISNLCSPLWTDTFEPSLLQQFHSSPAVRNGYVYVGGTSGNVYAFDQNGVTGCTAGNCSPLWETASPTSKALWTSTSPAVTDTTLFVEDSGGHVAAYPATGGCSASLCSPLWTATVPLSGSFTSPSVANGVLYAGSSSGALQAFDAAGSTGCSVTNGQKTCVPIWSFQTVQLEQGIQGSPTIANGKVYVGSSGGSVYAFGL